MAHPLQVVASLKACGQKKDLCRGISIHSDIVRSGLLKKSPFVANTLVSMYAKCGALAKAQEVFKELNVRNVVSWNTLIAAYAQQGNGEEALKYFEDMKCDGLSPNSVTFICALRACATAKTIDKGKQIHKEIASLGLLEKDVLLATALVDTYSKCGEFENAWQVFDELPVRDVVCWSSLIAGYAQQGLGKEAIMCFEQMQCEGVAPNSITYTSILKAYGSIEAATQGKQIHDQIISLGLLGEDVVLSTAVMDTYRQLGALAKAQQVLENLPVRDVVSWNALLTGYVQQGQGNKAMACFEQMLHDGVFLTLITFICILKACGSVGAAHIGGHIHAMIASLDLLGKVAMLGNTLVDMYAKCGALSKAQELLYKLPNRNTVTWTTLIAGYVQHDHGDEALDCYECMCCEGLFPNEITLISLLKACGSIGASRKGKEIYDEAVDQGLLGQSIVLANALVDMYARCGALVEAHQVVDKLLVRSIVSWNVLIGGYAQLGKVEEALNCLEQLQYEGLSPDAITFIGMLNACCRSGLVDEGKACVANMAWKYGVIPSTEHQTCMIDLYCRAGHFDMAIAQIKKVPSSHDRPLWSALMGACSKWRNMELGKWAFEYALQVDNTSVEAYIFMANMYADACQQTCG